MKSAAARQARAEHHHEPARERERHAQRHRRAEAAAPQGRNARVAAITRELRAREAADEDADDDHPLPVDFRRVIFQVRGWSVHERGRKLEGRRDAETVVGRREREPAQDADAGADGIGRPTRCS